MCCGRQGDISPIDTAWALAELVGVRRPENVDMHFLSGATATLVEVVGTAATVIAARLPT